MRSAKKENVRLAAATLVIERAYGKAVQPSENTPNPLEDAATDLLLEMRETIEQRRWKESGIGATKQVE